MNRTQLRAGLLTTSTSANVYSEAEPLVGFCIRRPQTRVWCGGGIALSHQRAGCSAVSAGGTGHVGSLGSERGCQVNRGRLGRDVDQGLTRARTGEVAKAEARVRDTTVWSVRRANLSASTLIPTYWFERTAARSYDRTTTVGHRHRGGLEIS